MPEILEAVTLRTPRRQWQHRVQTIQRLNRRLLIDAEHDRVLRRIQIQPDDIGGLGLKVRIIGSEIALKQMRLDAVLGPNARHGHVRDIATQFGGQLARRPVRGAVSGFVFGGARQNPRLQAIGHLVALAPGVASKKPGQTITFKALAPPMDVAVAAVQLGANRRPRQPIGEQQNQSGVASRVGSNAPGGSLLLKFHALALGQFHRNLHGCNDTSFFNVTVQ